MIFIPHWALLHPLSENEPFFKVLWLAAPHKQQGNSNWVKVTRSQKLKLPPEMTIASLWRHRDPTEEKKHLEQSILLSHGGYLHICWVHCLKLFLIWVYIIWTASIWQSMEKQNRCLWRKPLFLLFISHVFIISSVRRKSFSCITFTQKSDYRSYQPEHEPKTLCALRARSLSSR